MNKRNGHTRAKGTKVSANKVQMAVTFDTRTFGRLASLAKASDVSFAETVRVLVKKSLTPNLKRVA